MHVILSKENPNFTTISYNNKNDNDATSTPMFTKISHFILNMARIAA